MLVIELDSGRLKEKDETMSAQIKEMNKIGTDLV